MEDTSFRETGIVVFDGSVIYRNVGSSVHVEFDFLKIWNKIKNREYKTKQLYFIHTHAPESSVRFSHRDLLCMQSLYAGLGCPIDFLIYSFSDNLIFDIRDCRFAHYVFDGKTIQLESILPKFPTSFKLVLELYGGYY